MTIKTALWIFSSLVILYTPQTALSLPLDDQRRNLLAEYDQLFSLYPSSFNASSAEFKKAPINWSSNAMARKYRTALTENYDAIARPNFDGFYIVVDDIGCGIACAVVFIIDARDGNVYYPGFYANVKFQLSSALIITKPMDDSTPNETDTYDDCMIPAEGPPELAVFDGTQIHKIPMEPCKPSKLLNAPSSLK